MTNPKISVLTAVYKSAELICPAIESVLNQTFDNFEWVIINDATPDNSIEIIESYNDPRIKIYHNDTNIGLAASLNKGLDLCTGEYIARMDTDDVCYPNRFEQQVKFMESHSEIAIAGSWVNLTGEKKGVWKTPVKHEEIQCKLIFNSAIAHPTVMMRKVIIEKYGFRYDERLRRIQDYDLWVRASQIVKLANIPEVLLDYRIDDTSKTDEVIKRANVVIYSIRQKQLDKLGIVLTKEEADNLHYISAGKFDEITCAVANRVIESIIKRNRVEKIYDQRALEKYLGRVLIRMGLKKPSSFFKAKLLLITTAIKSLFL